MKIFRLKKKNICKILLLLAAVLINVWVCCHCHKLSDNRAETITFMMKYSSDIENTIQIFFASGTEAVFTEENSVSFEYSGTSDDMEISVEIPADTGFIRVDFGNRGGVSSISDMKTAVFGKISALDISAAQEPFYCNLIADIHRENDRVIIAAEDSDPYIVMTSEGLRLRENIRGIYKKIKLQKIIFAALLCLVTDITSIAAVHYFDELIRMPLNIFRERKMFGELVKNDFQARFAGSYFGVFWAFVQPVITMALYWFVFQVGLRAGNVSDYPFILFLMSGMIPWLYFSEALNSSTNSLIEYSYLVKKVVFNIEILPALKVASSLFVHVAFVVFLSVICVSYGYMPSLYWLQLLYYIPCTSFLVLGLSYITSSCAAFFKDTIQIVNILLTIGVWITPVMWNPMGTISETLHNVFKLNPVYYIIDGFRDSMLGKVWFWEKPLWTVMFWVIALSVYIIGVRLFNKLKVHFADVL